MCEEKMKSAEAKSVTPTFRFVFILLLFDRAHLGQLTSELCPVALLRDCLFAASACGQLTGC